MVSYFAQPLNLFSTGFIHVKSPQHPCSLTAPHFSTTAATAVNPATPIALAAGWGIVSYLPSVAIDAAAAFSSISGQLIIAKNNAGQTYIPQYGINNIGRLQPGQGYMIYLNAVGTLVYPSGSRSSTSELTTKNTDPDIFRNIKPDHFQFTAHTGENSIIVLPTACEPQYSDGAPLENGDEIGIFTSEGKCCGAVVWQAFNAAITVWGNNMQTDSPDGFQAGEAFYFRLRKKSDLVEYPVTVGYQEGHPATYQPDGFSVLNEFVVEPETNVANTTDSDLPSEFQLYQNYPNPFNPETVIEYSLPKPAFCQLHIYNTLGQRIRTLLAAQQAAGIHRVIWDGRNDEGKQVTDGIYIYRIITSGFTATQKMLLLK